MVTEPCHILREDPDLADHLSGERFEAAVNECVARTFVHRPGPWSPPPEAEAVRDTGVGLLVMEGLVVRQIGVAGRFGAELLGEGDVVCPWQWDGGQSLPQATHWRVLRDCRFAILDVDFTRSIGQYPEIIGAVVTRALQRARHIGVIMAIVQQPRIDVRLHMLFWEFADRWGTMRQDGVHIAVPLTHATLSELVAARRPTVTKALGELADQGAVMWTGEDWLLPGEPPAEFAAVGTVMLESNRATTA